jgi:hypothetical protein
MAMSNSLLPLLGMKFLEGNIIASALRGDFYFKFRQKSVDFALQLYPKPEPFNYMDR